MKGINFTALVAVVILAVSLVMGLSFWEKDSEKAPSEVSSELIEKTRLVQKTRYVLREHEGNLAVFNDDGSISKVYEINVSLLPEYDQKLLQSGIAIVGEDELRARIEDYTS